MVGVKTKPLLYILCVLKYSLLTLLNSRDQYPVGRVPASSFFCSNRHAICLLHASTLNLICPVECGSAQASGKTCVSSSALVAVNYSLLSGLKYAA